MNFARIASVSMIAEVVQFSPTESGQMEDHRNTTFLNKILSQTNFWRQKMKETHQTREK
jgi:hypothetical protein